LKVTFTATATLKAYKVTWQGPYVKGASNGRFNEVVARYTAVQVVTATAGGGGGTLTGVTAGTGLSGGGTSGNVTLSVANGGVNTAQLADNSVTDAKITAVSGGKITGAVANATIATIATIATNATNAVNFSGSLNGDVTGNQGTTTVAKLQGRTVANTAPQGGQVLKFNSTTNQWEPDTDNNSPGGGGTITGVTVGTGLSGGGTSGNVTLGIANSGVGTPQLADNSVTDAKITAVSGSKVTGAVANATNAVSATNATNATDAVNATNATNAVNFSGSLNGDVTGTQGTTTVAKLQGRTVANTTPQGGQVLKFNSTTNQWEPDTDNNSPGGGGTITGVTAGTGLSGGGTSGNVTVAIASGGVNTTQLADNGVTAPKIASGQVVKTLNGLTDSVTLAAGSNVTLTPSGNTLTIAATAGTAGSGTAGAIAKWVSSTSLGNSALTENSGTGNIGIGAAPLGGVKLAVTGTNTLAGIYGKTTDSSYGVQGDSVSGAGVIGNSFSGPGLSGNSGNSRGVFGQSSSDVGVLGLSDPNGLGITAPGGTGVLGAGSNNGIVGYSATGLAGNFLGRIFVDSATSNSTANNAKAAEVARTGSFNTTGGALTGYSGYFSNTATRVAGSNNLVNVGLFVTASGAQNNYAAIFDQGNVGIGTTAPSERLQVAGVIHSTTGGIRFPDGSLQLTAAAGGGSGGVSNVTASVPLASSGGATPNISLTGVVPIANGGTGSATQNVC
jgi:hypothetical protein